MLPFRSIVCLLALLGVALACSITCDQPNPLYSAVSTLSSGEVLLNVSRDGSELCGWGRNEGQIVVDLRSSAFRLPSHADLSAVQNVHPSPQADYEGVAFLSDSHDSVYLVLLHQGASVWSTTIDIGQVVEPLAVTIGPTFVSVAKQRAYFLYPKKHNGELRTQLMTVGLDGSDEDTSYMGEEASMRSGDTNDVQVFDEQNAVLFGGMAQACVLQQYYTFGARSMRFITSFTPTFQYPQLLPSGDKLVKLNTGEITPQQLQFSVISYGSELKSEEIVLNTADVRELIDPETVSSEFWWSVLWVSLSILGTLALFALIIGVFLYRRYRKDHNEYTLAVDMDL